MATSAEDAINDLVSRLGLVGPQAETVARSLAAMSNASSSYTSAKYSETEAIRGTISEQEKNRALLRSVGTTLKDFTTGVFNAAESAAGSGGVFTSVTPAINFFAENIAKASDILPKVFQYAGIRVGQLFSGPAGAIIGGKMGEGLGKFLDGTIKVLAPVITTIANQYLQQGEKVIQAFNSLSSVGITLGGSIENMQRIIANTNMPLEMLAKIAQQNAENLALLGGGTAGALERVAKAARHDLGPQLVTLYGGFSNLSDELVDYLAMEQRRGVSENLLSAENIEGTKAYLYQLKEISALTGKSSKQIKAEIEARARNAATQGMLANMSRTQRDNFDKLMQTIPEGAREAMQDLVLAQSRGLEPVSRQFLELEAIAPVLVSAMRRAAGDLGKSPEEFNKSLGKASADMATESSKITQMMGDILYLKQAGRVSASVINTLDTTLTSLNENKTRLESVANDIKTFAETTKAMKTQSEGFLTQVGSIYDAQANLAKILNETILGNKDYPQKFKEFADLTNYATNLMGTVIKNMDNLISNIIMSESGESAEIQGQRRKTESASELREIFLRGTGVYQSSESLPEPGTDINSLNQQQQQILKNLDRRLIEQRQKLENMTEKLPEKPNSESNKPTNEPESTSPTSSTKPIPVTNAQNTTLSINPDSIILALTPMIENQNRIIEDLRESMKNQGSDFRKAARMIA
jgi:hypothetical protein